MPGPDLHIISFAVPYPPVYGGAIDVYNRIKALHREGVNIHLHCFVYGNYHPHNALNEITRVVHYYPRITWPALLAPGTPYIVASRRNPGLLEKLNEDAAPVLFEGIHTTGFIEELKDRKKLLRAHNIEHQYYHELAKDSSRFQYLFFQRESLALERYEAQHAKDFDHVFAISQHDRAWYLQQGAKADFAPVFHGFDKTEIRQGRGEYVLFVGDMSIESNQRSVLEFLRTPGIESFPVVVVGRRGDKSFEEKLTKFTNVRREAGVSDEAMKDLLCNAQVIVVHSRHSSGMKVRLFNALYHCRFIVVNEPCLTGTTLDNAVHVCKDLGELPGILNELWVKDFNDDLLKERTKALAGLPGDQEKAQAILRCL